MLSLFLLQAAATVTPAAAVDAPVDVHVDAPVDAAAPDAASDPRYIACVELIGATPQLAIERAEKWGAADGGWKASSCLGLAYAQLGRWDPAATAFETAATGAARAGNTKESAMAYVQAGNAALAANNADRALRAFEKAEATGALQGVSLGQLNMDRGRAGVMKGDLPFARTAMDKATELLPKDPLAWLLSAALARRMNDLPRAKADIETAMDINPHDATILLEAGKIALVSGYPGDAEEAWRRAIIAEPQSQAAAAARQALAENGMGVPVETTSPTKTEENTGR